MKFTTSISAGLILATTVLALPFENFPQYCQENQNTSLQCLYEHHSGVMFKCSDGKVLDYSCPGDQHVARDPWLQQTLAIRSPLELPAMAKHCKYTYNMHN
ncbi:hypothetical protein K493DRAFT_303393 [Basidiobolus meristosporus CBS 931.73]|uniref:Carbohydrate-binding module family 19 domain-containing protein n=1 Tax=Basidiobolus meristosporus CBS 931.73 TaxID=1314790 RepID=A0A1Y1Y2X6_9FUNG|nr:hypothetical protein K493DRAFT_303393 [Basidiobolus meristosporus CBS 931.73]|eukprot:ORX92353.1 hypothetical protein K493DRAFT_303393 [Basidiobolus meristosporus CBS 931.73]